MTFKKLLREWILPFAIEIAVLLLVVRFVFFFVIVPTGSMIPTVDEHSFLFALRVNDLDNLERGDVVVFRSDELDKTLVKRLVGLPGEEVRIADGVVYIDGELLEEPYVLNQETEYYDVFEVGEGEYFFLGDNRSGSYDARYWEQPYIPGDAIEGRAVFTLWPFGNFGRIK